MSYPPLLSTDHEDSLHFTKSNTLVLPSKEITLQKDKNGRIRSWKEIFRVAEIIRDKYSSMLSTNEKDLLITLEDIRLNEVNLKKIFPVIESISNKIKQNL